MNPLSAVVRAMVLRAIGRAFEPHRGDVKPDMFDTLIMQLHKC